MREIKFRAWDKELKGFCEVFVSHNETLNDKFRDSDYDFQQYTGLKDKNGKEIYEGDIVRTKVNLCVWLFEVATAEGFGNNLFLITRYRNFDVKPDSNHYLWGDFYVNHGRDLLNNGSRLEVIGNIYENKELLDGEKDAVLA